MVDNLSPIRFHHKTLIAVLWIFAFASIFVYQREIIHGILKFRRVSPVRPVPRLRRTVFNLTDFGGVGDGVTVNTAAFEKAVEVIAKLRNRGGGQLNVPAGRWLTAPFNLTSCMTLFLAEDAVILGIQDEKYWPLLPPLPSYGYGREHAGSRYGSLIHGQKLKDVVITGKIFHPSSSEQCIVVYIHVKSQKLLFYTSFLVITLLFVIENPQSRFVMVKNRPN